MSRMSTLHVTTALVAVVLLALATAGMSGMILAMGGRRLAQATLHVHRSQRELRNAEEARRGLREEELRARQCAERVGHLQESTRGADYNAQFARDMTRAAAASGNRLEQIQVAAADQSLEALITSLTPRVRMGGAAPASDSAASTLKTEQARLIDITLRGSFDSAVRFMENLHRFPRIVAIEELRLQPEPRGANEPVRPLLIRLRLATLPIHRPTASGAPGAVRNVQR